MNFENLRVLNYNKPGMAQVVLLVSGHLGEIRITRWQDQRGDTLEICSSPSGAEPVRCETTPELAAFWNVLTSLDCDDSLCEDAADNGLAPICGWPE